MSFAFFSTPIIESIGRLSVNIDINIGSNAGFKEGAIYKLANRKKALQALLLGTAILLGGCSETGAQATKIHANKNQADNVQPYAHKASSAVLSEQAQYRVDRKFIGKVQAKQNANLGFEQAGKVVAIFVDEGKRVKQGELLARQDTTLLLIERKELKVQLSQTKADQKLVKTNLKRITALSKKNYSSVQSLDELQTRQQVLALLAQRINTKLAANQIRINKSSLYAPFDAVISKRFIAVGEVVSPGAAAIKLLQTADAEIIIGMPVALINQLDLSQQLTVTIARKTHQVALLAKGSDVDPLTRTVQLRFKLLNNIELINGQLAYLNLPQVHQTSGYWVPITALTDGVRGLWNIYILQPQQQPQLFKLQSRNVDVLYLTQDKAYIRGALENGERYLTAGLHRLVPGQLVTTSKTPARAASLARTQ